MLDFVAMQRALENEVAAIACPSCHGTIEVRLGDMKPGRVARCAECDFEVPITVEYDSDRLIDAMKGDLAFAFKRAFKAIEDFTTPPA